MLSSDSSRLVQKLDPRTDKPEDNILALMRDIVHIERQCRNYHFALLFHGQPPRPVPHYFVLAGDGHNTPPFGPILCRVGNLWVDDDGIWYHYGHCGTDGRGDPAWGWIRDNRVRNGKEWPSHHLDDTGHLRLSEDRHSKLLKWELRDTVCKRRREARRCEEATLALADA